MDNGYIEIGNLMAQAPSEGIRKLRPPSIIVGSSGRSKLWVSVQGQE